MTSQNGDVPHGEPAAAPKLRIVTRPHETLGDEPTPSELAAAIGSLEACVHHNFRAVEQDLDDVRAGLQMTVQTAGEGLATGRRIESLLQQLIVAIAGFNERVARLERGKETP